MNSEFDNLKAEYLARLGAWSNSVKFFRIGNSDNGSENSGRLNQCFVMPDVIEEVDIHSRSGKQSPILASQLLNNEQITIVVLGDPGSGKTALLNFFVTMLAQGTTGDRLPILIDVRSLIHFQTITFLGYSHHFAEQTLGLHLPNGFFAHWLKSGKAVILIDGLDAVDEISDSSKRLEVLVQIENLLGYFRKSLVIVTSRPAGYRRDFLRGPQVTLCRLQPFDDLRINKFIDRWCDNQISDEAEAQLLKYNLDRSLGQSARLEMLARNPLLLTMMISFRRYQSVLPSRRYQLYEKIVATSLNRSGVYDDGTNPLAFLYLDVDDVRRLTEVLAYWIHTCKTADSHGTLITKGNLLDKLTQEIKSKKSIDESSAREEAKRFVDFLCHRAGLLTERGKDLYAFVNKTFQEYLCAQEISYQAHDDDDFSIVSGFFYKNLDNHQNLDDPHWREVLLFLISQLPQKKAARVLRIILNNNSVADVHNHRRNLLFAGSCLAENLKDLTVVESSLIADILHRLVDLEVQDESQVGVRVRAQVFQILSSMIGTEFEAQTWQLLKKRCTNEHQLASYKLALEKV